MEPTPYILRETLDRVNLDLVDPPDTMVNFIHRMSFKKTNGFEGVRSSLLETYLRARKSRRRNQITLASKRTATPPFRRSVLRRSRQPETKKDKTFQ